MPHQEDFDAVHDAIKAENAEELARVADQLRDMYESMSFKMLRKMVRIDHYALRDALYCCDIPLRPRGKSTTFRLTEELFEEICRDGVLFVAQRIGMSHHGLRYHLSRDPRVPEWSKKLATRPLAPLCVRPP